MGGGARAPAAWRTMSGVASELTIRRAEPGDLPAVTAIERGSFSDPWSASAFLALLERSEALFCVATTPRAGEAGEGREEVIGFTVGYVALDQAELANVAVRAEARGRGVGRRLVEHVIRECAHRGALELFLEVRESNAAARGLYRSEGFSEIGRRRRYYERPVEDALILRRPLHRGDEVVRGAAAR